MIYSRVDLYRPSCSHLQKQKFYIWSGQRLYSCLFYVDHLLMKKLELSKSNVDGKYILISTPNELFFLSVEIVFSKAIF